MKKIICHFDEELIQALKNSMDTIGITSEVRNSNLNEHIYQNYSKLPEYCLWVKAADFMRAKHYLITNDFINEDINED